MSAQVKRASRGGRRRRTRPDRRRTPRRRRRSGAGSTRTTRPSPPADEIEIGSKREHLRKAGRIYTLFSPPTNKCPKKRWGGYCGAVFSLTTKVYLWEEKRKVLEASTSSLRSLASGLRPLASGLWPACNCSTPRSSSGKDFSFSLLLGVEGAYLGTLDIRFYFRAVNFWQQKNDFRTRKCAAGPSLS